MQITLFSLSPSKTRIHSTTIKDYAMICKKTLSRIFKLLLESFPNTLQCTDAGYGFEIAGQNAVA